MQNLKNVSFICSLLFILFVTPAFAQDLMNGFQMEDQEIKVEPEVRMQNALVNGMCVAIIKDNMLDTVVCWGLADKGNGVPASLNTLFQAGGMTVPLTNIATLRAWEQGLIDLDTDVNQYLKSWKLPDNRFTKKDPVTIRDLLTKSRGFTQYFKPTGYRPDETIPTLQQVLKGEAPAKNKPVKLRSGTHKRNNYSFETELVLQQLLEDVYDLPFDQLMKREVLEPAGMENSVFMAALTEDLETRAAVGYTLKGERIVGDRWVHPELGSAGLWTTAGDYAHLLENLLAAYNGEEGKILKPQTVRDGFLPINQNKALIANSYGPESTVYYGGASMGFRTQMEIFPKRGWGLVILMNSHVNWRFTHEITRALKDHLGF